MPRSHPVPTLPAGPAPPGRVMPAAAFAAIGVAVAVLAAGAATLLMPDAGIAGAGASLAVMSAVTWLGLRALRRGHPHPHLGLANAVTLARAGITSLLAAALCLPGGIADRPALAWTLVAVVALGLLMDGADGWLARRSGLASPFGARFDMEVDALLAALLCLVAIQAGKAGLWLLPLGFLRYGWVMAGLALPWLTRNLPDRAGRKTVCVIQIAVLTALIAPIIVPPLSVALALAATAALAWSFAADAVWLWRRR